MLKVHQLELFYYVTLSEGITQASREMPYAVTQPGISRQMLDLEKDCGMMLFQRKPFALTPAGERLFAFIKPFFDGLNRFPKELHDQLPVRVRIAGPPVVLRDYLPRILRPLAQAFPNLSPHLKAGLQGEIEEWLKEGEADLAITLLEEEPPRGCSSRPLLTLPLALLVPASAKITDFSQLCRNHPRDRLISPPEGDAITRAFERGLKQQAIRWELHAEMNSIELVESYVAQGFGVGLTLLVPGCNYIPEVRVLPLPGFPGVPVGLIWRRDPAPVTEALMRAMEQAAELIRRQQSMHHASAA
jgi:DNA-binding transcriptional LysR family regulator